LSAEPGLQFLEISPIDEDKLQSIFMTFYI